MNRFTRRSCLAALAPARLLAQAKPGGETARLRGTWTALSADRTLQGTWTARLDAAGMDGWGTWELHDPAGKRIASGTWSARKADDAWDGGWLAEVQGGGSHSGTWTSETQLPPEARFVRLLESAIADIVRGEFSKTTGPKGTWAIRATLQ